jgi:hypothetical protein
MAAKAFGDELGMHCSDEKLADSRRMYMAAEIVFRACRKKIRGGDKDGEEDGDVEDIRWILDPWSLHYFDRR